MNSFAEVSNKIDEHIKGTSGWVIFFGVFTACCLILQCLDKLLDTICGSTIITYFNQNFILPIDTLTTLYAILCASYIGVDRASFALSTFKGTKNVQDYGNAYRLRHIIIQNFIICILAIILNRFFDVPLGLESLFTSFGLSVILYVGGQKSIFAASKLANDENNNGIDDRIENDKELIKTLNYLIKENKKFKIYYKDLSNRESLIYTNDENDKRNNSRDNGYQRHKHFDNLQDLDNEFCN